MVAAGSTWRYAMVTGAALLGGMGILTACGSTKETPTPSTSSDAVSVTPTEKNLTPGGNNSFAPTVKSGSAPTALPGSAVTGG